MSLASTVTVKHVGGCHCGCVRFEIEAPARIEVAECNCSICAKVAYLHLIVPAERFHLLAGREDLTTYTFNTGVARHHFCKHCGVKSFYIPRSHPDGVSVNARWCRSTAGTGTPLAPRGATPSAPRIARRSAPCRRRTTSVHNQALDARYVQERATFTCIL
jgi:hypothetical protein